MVPSEVLFHLGGRHTNPERGQFHSTFNSHRHPTFCPQHTLGRNSLSLLGPTTNLQGTQHSATSASLRNWYSSSGRLLPLPPSCGHPPIQISSNSSYSVRFSQSSPARLTPFHLLTVYFVSLNTYHKILLLFL